MKKTGSHWFKVDFHCHSPASDDYPRDSEMDKDGCSPEQWLLEHMKHEIDCVVLSDHNTGAWIDEVRAALVGLKERSEAGELTSYRDIHIIPAVELTAAGNCHVLGLFPESFKAENIARVVGSCEPPVSKDKNHQTILGSGVPRIISKIKDAGGIAILAHVDKAKGIFKNTNQGEVRAAFNAEPDAVELIGSNDELDGFAHSLVKDLAKVKGSDAHCREQMGRSFTWVKMSQPSFDGIKIALTDPDHCIIKDGNPPRYPSYKISKMSLKTYMCKDLSDHAINIELSPWYTAIVGSRGSGKSTVVEAVRLALKRDTRATEPKLSSDIEKRLSDFKNTSEGAVRDDSYIELVYEKDSQNYKLTWTPTSHTLFKYDIHTSDWTEDPTFDVSRFPVSIYSQKMLFDIATKPNAFLKVIDDSEVVKFAEWESKNKELQSDYKGLCHDLREVESSLNEIPKIQGNLTDINNKLKTLESCGLSEKQTQLSNYQKEMSQAGDAISKINSHLDSIKAALNEYEEIVVTNTDTELDEFLKSVHKIQGDLLKNTTEKVKDAESSLEALQQKEYFLQLKENIKVTTSDMKVALDTLEDAEISPDKLDHLLTEREQLAQKVAKKASLEDKRVNILQRQSDALIRLIEHRKDLTKRRKDFIDNLGLTDLRISILPLASKPEELILSYQQATGIDRFSSHILESERSSGLLSKLDKLERQNPKLEVNRFEEVEKLKQFHRGCRNYTDNTNYDIHGALKTRISQLPDEQLDNFDCWFPDDGIDIKFFDVNGQKRPLDKASPGQKSASMLTFLMSYGSDPLILDQPEDDLDCAMLAETVIPAISKNKQRRQLILVTHSAPIVVNGDAEYIIGMSQNQMRLTPHITGGIQEQEVKDFICKQMEGGEKAFRSRFKRIIG